MDEALLEPLPEPRISVFHHDSEGVPLAAARDELQEGEEAPEALSPNARRFSAFDLNDDGGEPDTPLVGWYRADNMSRPASPLASEPAHLASDENPPVWVPLQEHHAESPWLPLQEPRADMPPAWVPLREPRISAVDLTAQGDASHLLEPLPEPRVSAFDLDDEGDLPYAPLTRWAHTGSAASVIRSPRRPLSAGATCAVCLETLDDRGCAELPCDHVFHRDCVLPWIARRGTCPTCRSRYN